MSRRLTGRSACVAAGCPGWPAQSIRPALRGSVRRRPPRLTVQGGRRSRRSGATRRWQQAAAEHPPRRRRCCNSAHPALPTRGAASATFTTLIRGAASTARATTPQNQLVATVTVSALLFAPVAVGAARAGSGRPQHVAELAAAEVRRQVARRDGAGVPRRHRAATRAGGQQRARDVAQAHYEYAQQRREIGAGSRLNELRAQQSVSSDEVLVEEAAPDLYRAQEALGVLVADDGPLTAADEPVLEVPASLDAPIAAMPSERTDLRLARGRVQAAARVVSDSWKDWLPSVAGLFQPQCADARDAVPAGNWSWRVQFVASMPDLRLRLPPAEEGRARRCSSTQTHIELDALLRAGEVRRADGAGGRRQRRAGARRRPGRCRSRPTKSSTSSTCRSRSAPPRTSRSSTPSASREMPTPRSRSRRISSARRNSRCWWPWADSPDRSAARARHTRPAHAPGTRALAKMSRTRP